MHRARAPREGFEALMTLTEARFRALLAGADAARRRARVERDRAASVIDQILGVEP